MGVRIGLVAALVCTLCAPFSVAQETTSRAPSVLATVGDFNVTPSHADYVIRNRFAREIMEQIIRNRVIEDEARVQGVRASTEDVTREVERRKSDFATDADFLVHIQQMGYSVKGYRECMRTQLLLGGLLDKAAAVTDADARAYYDARAGEFGAETQLHILDVATATQQDAIVAYRAILDGTPFEVAARRFRAEDSPGKDGDLGWVTKETIPVKSLWEWVEALNVGDMTEPFPLEGKFHIIRVAGRRTGATMSFEAVKEQIKGQLRKEKGISEDDYVTSLLAKADITVPWEPVSYLQSEYALLKGIRVSVDDRVLRLAQPPYINPEGVMMIPAKPVLQAIGASVTWRPGVKVMEIKRAGIAVSVSLGEKTVVIGGDFGDMNAAAVVKDGTIFIPPRTVLAALGVSLYWNPTTKVLAISTAASE